MSLSQEQRPLLTQASECWEQLLGRGSEYVSPLFTSNFKLEGLWGGVALFVRKVFVLLETGGDLPGCHAHCDSPSLQGEAELVLCLEPQGLVLQVPQLRTSSRGLSLSVTNKQVGEEAGLWSMPMAPTFLQARNPSSCQQVALGCGHRSFLLQVCQNASLQKLLLVLEIAPLT